MLDKIVKVSRDKRKGLKFSIVIPTWNNLDYLKLLIKSIDHNSYFKHQIIVIINEGKDGTLKWIKSEENIDYVYSEENIGICFGLNSCRSLVKTDYIVYANDDMYFLPDWDLELFNEIESIGHKMFMLSCTMIEPYNTSNSCVIVKNYGDTIENFNESKLLNEYKNLSKKDWSGSTWPPNIVHIDLWDLVGGMSIEYTPGMYSDPDLSQKIWKTGVRYYKGLGRSKAYHFGSKSTKRVSRNKGSETFLHKWGITANTFLSIYLQRGMDFNGYLRNINLSFRLKILNKLKRIIKSFM
ncbi:glycosyltransferase family 2 protein [Bacteroidota bacterium]